MSVVAILAVLAAQIVGAAPEGAVLAERGETSYRIVQAAQAPNEVRFAVWDLQRILKDVTGAEFSVVEEGSTEATGPQTIEVGTRRAAELIGDRQLGSLGYDGSVSALVGETVVLAGKPKAGVMGAVYDFLEREVGCRWYTQCPSDWVTPKRGRLVVKPFRYVVEAPFEDRYGAVASQLVGYVRNGNLFSIRNGCNIAGEAETFENMDLPPGCAPLECKTYYAGRLGHTTEEYVPPHPRKGTSWQRHKIYANITNDYFREHPEWFSLTKTATEEKRVDNRQWCFSNPGLRAEFKKRLFESIEKTDRKCSLGLGNNDYPGRFCDCDACHRLEDLYDTPGGAYFDFVREIAEATYARYPNVTLKFSAYHRDETQRAPNGRFGRFPPNCKLSWAPIDGDFAHDYAHPNNAIDLFDMRRWTAHVDRITAWYYPITYNRYPYSGLRRMAADIRMMQAAGLTGMGFEQDVGVYAGEGFFDLVSWVMLKLFRNPQLDENELAKDFFRGYYGAAADLMYVYYDELERRREDSTEYTSFSKVMREKVCTPKNVGRWTVLFDRMDELVKDDPLTRVHVDEARLNLDYAMLSDYQNVVKAAGESLKLPTPEEILARATNAIVRGYGRRNLSLWEKKRDADVEDYVCAAKLAMVKDVRPVELKDVPDDDFLFTFKLWLDRTGGRRPMEGAKMGEAVWCEKENVSTNRVTYDFWDRNGRRNLLRGEIRPEDMAEGVFKLYKLGRFRFNTNNLTLAFGKSQTFFFDISSMYVAGTDDTFDAYVTARFEGPKYFPGSTKPNMAAYDEVILVRVRE